MVSMHFLRPVEVAASLDIEPNIVIVITATTITTLCIIIVTLLVFLS